MSEWRNRIKEVRTVTADELKANPRNWRRHPQRQNEALRAILREIGIADHLKAYYSERAGDVLTLLDGHLRLDQGGEWPIAILDINDAEADKLLAVFDPLTGMAQTDADALDDLLRDVQTGEEALQRMLSDIAEEAGLYNDPDEPLPGTDDVVPEQWGVMVQCDNEMEQADLLSRLDAEGYECHALIS